MTFWELFQFPFMQRGVDAEGGKCHAGGPPGAASRRWSPTAPAPVSCRGWPRPVRAHRHLGEARPQADDGARQKHQRIGRQYGENRLIERKQQPHVTETTARATTTLGSDPTT